MNLQFYISTHSAFSSIALWLCARTLGSAKSTTCYLFQLYKILSAACVCLCMYNNNSHATLQCPHYACSWRVKDKSENMQSSHSCSSESQTAQHNYEGSVSKFVSYVLHTIVSINHNIIEPEERHQGVRTELLMWYSCIVSLALHTRTLPSVHI